MNQLQDTELEFYIQNTLELKFNTYKINIEYIFFQYKYPNLINLFELA